MFFDNMGRFIWQGEESIFLLLFSCCYVFQRLGFAAILIFSRVLFYLYFRLRFKKKKKKALWKKLQLMTRALKSPPCAGSHWPFLSFIHHSTNRNAHWEANFYSLLWIPLKEWTHNRVFILRLWHCHCTGLGSWNDVIIQGITHTGMTGCMQLYSFHIRGKSFHAAAVTMGLTWVAKDKM